MIKAILGMTASIGVSQVMNNILTITTPDNLSKAKKVATMIGGSVIAIMVNNKVVELVENEYDEFLDIFNKNKEEEILSE